MDTGKSYWLLATLITVHVFLCMPSFGSTASTARDSGLTCRIPSGCSCPGETVTCKCIAAAGTRFIEWTGSIFEIGDGSCTGIVVHNDNIPGECKEMVASGYSALDSHFVSVLNFTANPQYNGKTVQCLTDHGPGRSQALLGNVTIGTTPGPIQALQDVRLLNATKDYLTFNWTRASSNCTSLWYTINATKDCGVCPNRTNSTQVVCSLLEVPTNQEKVCKFTVNIAVCGDEQIWKSESNTVTVELRLPDPPFIECNPIFENGLFQSLNCVFTSTMDAFQQDADMVSDDSVLSYTIAYSDLTSSNLRACDSVTIKASSCGNGLCSHQFQPSSFKFCQNSAHIIVTVFATNLFGDGSISVRHLSTNIMPYVDGVTEIDVKEILNMEKAILIIILLPLILIVIVVIYKQLRRRHNKETNGHKSEKELDLTTTHALCLEVKDEHITDHRHRTVPMAEFARKFLPGYRSDWQCGYYEFRKLTPENFTPDQRILLYDHKDKKISKLVETTISNIMDSDEELRNVDLEKLRSKIRKVSIKDSKQYDLVFIKSRNDDYELSVGQKFLYCAQFTEVNGHVEQCNEENSDCRETVHDFAVKKFSPRFKSGFAYHEVRSEDDIKLSVHKLVNKSVILSKKKGCDPRPSKPPPGKTGFYSGTNAYLLIFHRHHIKYDDIHKVDDEGLKDQKVLEDHIMSSCLPSLDDLDAFIHTSGRVKEVGDRRILFCVKMDRIDTSSYYKTETVSQKETMTEVGRRTVGKGVHYDQELGYGYREIKQGSSVFLKQYKNIVLMDEEKHLFSGVGAQRFLGLNTNVQTIDVPNLEKTPWKHIFVQSTGKHRELTPESTFLFCAPLNKLDAYYEIYTVNEDCKMFTFAKSKIPGFNPIRGFGYIQLTSASVAPQSTIILMNKSGELFSGPGAYYYAKDETKRKELEWEYTFIQSKSFETKLSRDAKFLYCEYSQP